MNRLVIIGNGFDLAHGLPTSYKDFIDDYWRGIKDSNHNDEFISFVFKSKVEFENIKNIGCISKQFIAFDEKVKFSEAEIYYEGRIDFKTGKPSRKHILKYKNDFFRLINQKSIENWVDVENEYYRGLKMIVKSTSINAEHKKRKVIILNKEFEQVKSLLEKYLAKKVNVKSAFENNVSNVNEILSFFKIQFKYLATFLNVESKEAIAYSKEFNNEDLDDLESFDYKIIEASKKGSLYQDLKSGIIEQNNLFLNFNYTSTINKYIKLLNSGDYCGKVEEVQIHGKLYDFENKINFGFGDEMDEDYKIIENIDDNEYLKNFKSFGYSQNSNYRKLLDFIDGNKFQVFIMGHSCGLSDRTLLNTVFEHNNCRSIKVFFYEIKDEEEKILGDNYTELVQNISRHFDDKKLMRQKIVNKNSCKPLPQIQLL